MKVCDLTQSYLPLGGGGIRTYLHAKRDYLIQHTADAYLRIVPGERDQLEKEERASLYTVASPRTPDGSGYRLLWRSDKVLRILERERPAVIEALCAYNLPWTALYYRRRHPASAVVGGYRTDFPRAYVQPLFTRWAGQRAGTWMTQVANRYVRALYNQMDLTYALSPSFLRRLEELGVRRLHRLPLGVDGHTFHPLRRSLKVRESWGAQPHQPVLIYAGRLDEEKQPQLVVQAFARLPPRLKAHLVLVGHGPLRPALEAARRKLPRLHLVPFVEDRAQLGTLLASADLYVTAMAFETFGISVVEAQASGLPVVGVRSGAMPDRVPPELGRLGEVGNVEQMAHNIQLILGGPRAEMGRRARAWAVHHHSWSRTFQQLWSLYRLALEHRRAES